MQETEDIHTRVKPWTTRNLPTGFIEVCGLDLGGELASVDRQALNDLMDRNGLLLFRAQQLTGEDHIRFASIFGPVADELGDGSHYSLVSNIKHRENGKNKVLVSKSDALPLHADFSFSPYAQELLSLYAMETSDDVPGTLLSNAAHAFASLPPALADRLESLTSVHAYEVNPKRYSNERVELLKLPPDADSKLYPRHAWPVVCAHPRTGERYLYVSEQMTSHIEGLPAEESEDLLQQIFAVLRRPEHLYEHRWRPGDLVIWDNLRVQHGRRSHDGTHRRILRRVAVSPYSTEQRMGVDSAYYERHPERHGSKGEKHVPEP